MIAACILAFFRRPYRRHLAIFGALLPLGVIAQAILGALVVKYDLRPELVMGHFILSMMLLDAGFALMWCSRYEPWDRRRSWDRKGVWAVRALVPLGQLTILAGTIATGSGPARGRVRRPARPALHLQGRPTPSNGWSSATRSSPRSTASRRSASGSTCAARAATGGR